MLFIMYVAFKFWFPDTQDNPVYFVMSLREQMLPFCIMLQTLLPVLVIKPQYRVRLAANRTFLQFPTQLYCLG
ncbi:hypothetical protein XENTR_v10004756 [Xenopus tropicalis]|nr:hypothetical protein XENTR_v10004756 [Xenopus tropicalis]